MEHPTAITTDIVRDRVQRDRRVSAALVGVGLILGIATLVFRIDAEHRYADRQRDAMRRGDLLSYPGEVVEVTGGGESGRDRIEVEYPGPQGTWVASVVVGRAGDYEPGDRVTVLDDLRHDVPPTVLGENYLPEWVGALWLPAIAAAALVAIGGAWFVATTIRRRRLATNTWEPRIVRSGVVKSGDSSTTYLFVEETDQLVSAYVVTRAAKAMPRHCVWRADVAGTEKAVFRPAESDRLVLATRRALRPLAPDRTLHVRTVTNDENGTALVLAGPDVVERCRIDRAYLREPTDTPSIAAGSVVDTMRIHDRYGMLRVAGDSRWVFAVFDPPTPAKRRRAVTRAKADARTQS